ncbi:YhgE/Pip domain-containing protein [Falsibacillus albus]|nr:YhgE/Pip domain-containing protein [Falsibacillus albus]
MNKILSIYIHDLKSLWKNWAAASIIIGLIILPSLYAWFNIKASWDPYSSTKGIKVAIINEDTGGNIENKSFNVGNEVVESLKHNHSLGWRIVNRIEAKKGIESGEYYASIKIPSDFSEKISTIVTDHPTKPELIYTVNEKLNPVAPKITAKGAAGIKDQISKQFVKNASAAIFDIFNELGIHLEKNLPALEDLKDKIFWLNNHFSEIERIIDTGSQDAAFAEGILIEAKGKLSSMQDLFSKSAAFSNEIDRFLQENHPKWDEINSQVYVNLALLQQKDSSIHGLINELSIDVPLSKKENISRLAIDLINGNLGLAKNLHSLLITMNKLSVGKINFYPEVQKIEQYISNLNLLEQQLDSAEKDYSKGKEYSGIEALEKKSEWIGANVRNMYSTFSNQLKPKLTAVIEAANNQAKETGVDIVHLQNELPVIEERVNSTLKDLQNGKKELHKIQNDLPAAKKKIENLVKQIRQFEQSKDIHHIIDLLINDVQIESDFFSEPVQLKDHVLYPIPNYGSAMSPFFTTLSLWVGAMLLISLIPANLEDRLGIYTHHQLYLGRFLTFATFSLLQALFVTLGDLYLLHTYVSVPTAFIGYGMLLSFVFMLIVYTLVSIFGNIGKGMGILLLVLQISGSGGTFPIQSTPHFFQKINPYLPFTYGISLLREAVGGIQLYTVKNDITIFVFIIFITMLTGFVLKGPINRIGSKFKNKAGESRLIH